jgi:predicted DNA-binding transcriptional regulator AlpA
MPESTPNAILIDGPELCRRGGFGVSSLHKMKRSDRLPLKPIRLGRKVLYRVSEFEAWVKAGCPAGAGWRAIQAVNDRGMGVA